jgi:hypothetical protein
VEFEDALVRHLQRRFAFYDLVWGLEVQPEVDHIWPLGPLDI